MSETLPDRIFLSPTARQESREFAAWFVRCSATPAVGIHPVDEPRVSAEFAATMSSLLDAIGSGRTITIGALPDELTTSVAAEQMGVSRTTLMKWVHEGTLPAHKVGTHTRLKTTDVMNLRKERAARQRKALEELLALESELDIQ